MPPSACSPRIPRPRSRSSSSARRRSSPPSRPGAGPDRERVTAAELSRHTLITPRAGSSIKQAADEFFARAGKTMDVSLESGDPFLLRCLVSSGFGAAVLPSSLTRAGGPAGRRPGPAPGGAPARDADLARPTPPDAGGPRLHRLHPGRGPRLIPDELPVEAVRDVVRRLGARQLAQVGGVQHEPGTSGRSSSRRRPTAARRRPRPVASGAATNTGSPGLQPSSRPFDRRAALDVGLDDPVEPARLRVDAPDVAVGPLVVAAVVDPRQLEALGELLMGDRSEPTSIRKRRSSARSAGLPSRRRSR